MDRVGLFVDAGYLLAEAGSVCCGTKRRSDIECDYDALVRELIHLAMSESELPLLRVYWYDAARTGAPAKDHLEVASLPNVKLRLGRLIERRGQVEQKGVDSLIIRDLMTLSHERAIATAYLLGGDEDLREGIAAAQDIGIRVIVVGVAAAEQNQSESLLQEADEHRLLDGEFLKRFFRMPAPDAEVTQGEPTLAETARRLGVEFAAVCTENMTRDQVSALAADYPRIPPDLDAQLLKEATEDLGSLRERFDLKVELRSAFWDGITKAMVEPFVRTD
jgi:uncharacterized LabA/DUF88 family protein